MPRFRGPYLPLLFIGIMLALVATAFAGPPFLTDDPEPVPFKHWELYLFSTVDVTRKSTDGTPGSLLDRGIRRRDPNQGRQVEQDG